MARSGKPGCRDAGAGGSNLHLWSAYRTNGAPQTRREKACERLAVAPSRHWWTFAARWTVSGHGKQVPGENTLGAFSLTSCPSAPERPSTSPGILPLPARPAAPGTPIQAPPQPPASRAGTAWPPAPPLAPFHSTQPSRLPCLPFQSSQGNFLSRLSTDSSPDGFLPDSLHQGLGPNPRSGGGEGPAEGGGGQAGGRTLWERPFPAEGPQSAARARPTKLCAVAADMP